MSMGETVYLNDFSKQKLFEIMRCIEEFTWDFFGLGDSGEDAFYDLLDTLNLNAIALPGALVECLEVFVFDVLDPLIEKFRDFPPRFVETTAGRKRNPVWDEAENEFRATILDPFKEYIKPILLM